MVCEVWRGAVIGAHGGRCFLVNNSFGFFSRNVNDDSLIVRFASHQACHCNGHCHCHCQTCGGRSSGRWAEGGHRDQGGRCTLGLATVSQAVSWGNIAAIDMSSPTRSRRHGKGTRARSHSDDPLTHHHDQGNLGQHFKLNELAKTEIDEGK